MWINFDALGTGSTTGFAEWNSKFKNRFAQARPGTEVALEALERQAVKQIERKEDAFVGELDELGLEKATMTLEELSTDLGGILMDRTVGNLNDEVRKQVSKAMGTAPAGVNPVTWAVGGIKAYFAIFKWRTEATAEAMAERRNRVMRPTQEKKEEFDVTA